MKFTQVITPAAAAADKAQDESAKSTNVDEVQAPTFEVHWSSHPISKMRVGPYTFENGVLTLTDPDDAEQFEKLHESLPTAEKLKITKIDVEGAANIARDFMKNRMRVGPDTAGTQVPSERE